VIQQEKPDLVLMGKQAVDLDDNQVAQLVSEYLGWGQACFASQIKILDGAVRVRREVDGGIEVLEIDLPGIISADLRLNEPRYPKLPDILKAKKKEIRTIAASELGINMSPKVVVTKLEQPSQRQAGRFVEDVVELVKALKEEAKVL
jgi:electron transfer flavoprotein beta subunit